MQKIIKHYTLIIFFIFFNTNSNAFFDPVYRCEVEGSYYTFDIGEIEKLTIEAHKEGLWLTDKTKSSYHLLQTIYTSKNTSYNLNWTINRKSLVVEVWRSKETSDKYSKGTQLRDALTSIYSTTGLCKKV